ncbi:CP4C1 protein, partial [Acromyrmex insinuator]
MLFVIIGLSLTCVAISYFVQNYRLFTFQTKPLPGPIRLPFIGSFFLFLYHYSEDYLSVWTKFTETYSSPFQIWIGPKLFIVVHELDQIKTILQNRHCLDKSYVYNCLKPVFDMGLVTAPASTWIESRKVIAPVFGMIPMKEYFNIFVRESLILIEDLEKNAKSGNEIECLDYLCRCTLQISCDTMMGVKVERNLIDEWWKESASQRQIWQHRFQNILLVPDVIFNLTPWRRKQQECSNSFYSIIEKIIQQRTNESNTMFTNDDTSHTRFCDILMRSFRNGKFTQKEIMDNIFTMLGASSDTTATTIHFVIIMMANFSEIQEKAYKELLEIYGTETPKLAPVKYEDLQHMHYLDCIIKETLRLFPIIPMIGRKLTEDLKMGEFVLPKGADVLISFIRMHRNEKYWPNPLMFNPDRFLQEKTNSIPYYYMPFSDGPRNCIGLKYAMISMKVILATLIRTFYKKFRRNRHRSYQRRGCVAHNQQDGNLSIRRRPGLGSWSALMFFSLLLLIVYKRLSILDSY